MNRSQDGPSIGDLVVCASRSYREQLNLELDVAMYMAGRRRDGLVHFARTGRSVWVPRQLLKSVDPADSRLIAPPSWLLRVHDAMRLVAASDVTFEDDEGGVRVARIGCPGLNGVLYRQLEAILGPVAGQLKVLPGSMSRVLVVFPLATDGPEPGAPTAPTPVDNRESPS